MALQTGLRMPVTEFDEWVQQPENADRDYEYIRGEVFEVVSNNYSSEIAALITTYLGLYLLQNKIGRITGADGGYQVGGERYIPDVAFISYRRQPQPSHAAYNPNPPDLAVEVLSPANDDEKMRVKVANYLAAGAVVWVVDPEARAVEVYTPGQSVRMAGMDEMLDGGSVLPGFQVAVRDIFPAEGPTQ